MVLKICWLLMLLYVKLTGTWRREFTVTGHSSPTWTDPISVAEGFTRPTASIHWKWFTGGGETIFCWTLVFIRTAWFLGSLETYPESPFEFLFAFSLFAFFTYLPFFLFSFLHVFLFTYRAAIIECWIHLFFACFLINFSIAAFRCCTTKCTNLYVFVYIACSINSYINPELYSFEISFVQRVPRKGLAQTIHIRNNL